MVSPSSSSAPRDSVLVCPLRPVTVTPVVVKSTRAAAAAASPANAAEISASSMPPLLRRKGSGLVMSCPPTSMPGQLFLERPGAENLFEGRAVIGNQLAQADPLRVRAGEESLHRAAARRSAGAAAAHHRGAHRE